MALEDVVQHAISPSGQPIRGEKNVTTERPNTTSFCAQVAEVAVDPDTGQVTVNKIITAHDVGTIMNPLTHQGQIEGGMVQGLGYGVMEEIMTADGQISTLSLGDYKLPTVKDIPELVTVLLKSSPGPAPYQGKGIGESSNIPVAAAIANAVAAAVGVRITELPVTAEKVFAALRAKSGA
jgi:CO/xanthine dehydrogenase Mo-binding subunit